VGQKSWLSTSLSLICESDVNDKFQYRRLRKLRQYPRNPQLPW